jgi:hypothetical protein
MNTEYGSISISVPDPGGGWWKLVSKTLTFGEENPGDAGSKRAF